MAILINVPDIGTEEVEVTDILVKVGDKIESEQSLITVEGDKASMEVPSPFAGIVKEIKIKVGDKVSTGSEIMIFEAEKLSTISTVSQEKLNMISSSEAEEHESEINTTLVVESKNDFTEDDTYVHATPLIRRLAREFGVNLAKVKGTGPKNRILRQDIQEYIKGVLNRRNEEEYIHATKSDRVLSGLLHWPEVDFAQFGETEEIELSRIQKISSTNLQRNWSIIPCVTQFDEADVTEVESFRKEQKIEAEKKKLNVKITLLVFIIKAVAKALEELPRFNSSFSEKTKKLILKKYINIGVAVETPKGLVVPVLRDVNKKSVLELALELTEISQKALKGNLIPADMQGGCFTISSLGNIGGMMFTPIINAPEVAILGVSKSLIKPVWNGDKFIPRLILPLSLSYDHRVIDGADGARFISFISKLMSDIRLLMM